MSQTPLPDIVENAGVKPTETKDEADVNQFVFDRIHELKEYRKQPLQGTHRSIEDIWTDADREYPPHDLNFGPSDKTRFVSDEDQGLRSRLVKVGDDDEWQSNMSSPDLYVKINTALSILVDENPEAVFIPAASKYEKNTELAYANWKNSWEVSGAKQQLKNFIFNLAKYGTAYGRTYPHKVEMKKTIRTESATGSTKAKDIEKKIIKFNDLCRMSINPWNVWVSEMTRVGDPLSMEDNYIEVDMSLGQFKREFPIEDFPNAKFVKEGMKIDIGKEQQEKPKNTITVGIYENQESDTFIMCVPSSKTILYSSPLPNDDGLISLWYAPWSLRDDRCPYGIGIYEIIRQSSIMYDRMNNMSFDQLTLSIYKMFFYKGLNALGENGKLRISPGGGEQVVDPKDITFLEVPGPGQEAWKGLQFLQDKMDTTSGVTQQLSGNFGGNTLGQDMQAKNSAMERMKTPLDYILDALQQEAYISLSWLKQILSVPEILEWSTPEDLQDALKEAGLSPDEIQQYMAASGNPQNELLTQDSSGTVDENGQPIMDENGQPKQPKKFANLHKEVSLSLASDDKGELMESEQNRFYRFGIHIKTERLDWKGIVRVKPQSVLQPSKELSKRLKLELFNLVNPALQAMLANPIAIPIIMPSVKQILKVYEEKPADWFDEKQLMSFYQSSQQPKDSTAPPKVTLQINLKDITAAMTPEQQQVMTKYLGIEPPMFVNKQPGAGTSPSGGQSTPDGSSGPTAPPPGLPSQISPGSDNSAPSIKPIANISETPSRETDLMQTISGKAS